MKLLSLIASPRAKLALAAFVCSVSGAAASVETPAQTTPAVQVEHKWELVKKDEELVVYERDVPGSSLIAFRGVGILDYPVAKVAAVILDNARAKEWVDSLEDSKILRRLSPFEYVEYNHIGTPFVMKDREFVSKVTIEINSEARSMALRYKTVDDPLAPKTGFIRGELMNSQFLLTAIEGGKKTQLSAEIHADPKGSVAKWIVNLFQRGWPRETFKGIKKQLAKGDLKTPEAFAEVISKLQF